MGKRSRAAAKKKESTADKRARWHFSLRRPAVYVLGAVVGALIASGVSFGFWYFGQQPAESKAAERQAGLAAYGKARDAYEDSRRMIITCRARMGGSGEGGAGITPAELAKADKRHTAGWKLMRSERYKEAVVAFSEAQELLIGCVTLG